MILTLTDVLPPPRWDAIPWESVRLEQASTIDGPFEAVETIAIPADPTPETPDVVNITTEDATKDFFRLIFISGLDESYPSDVIDRTSTSRVELLEPSFIAPTVEDISAILHGRLPDGSTGFDETTNPTDEFVQVLIDLHADEVFSRCESIPVKQGGLARHVVALETALAVERGFFPQESGSTDSTMANLQEDYNVKIVRLEQACKLASARVFA